MSVTAMERLCAVVLRERADDMLRQLMRLGCVSLDTGAFPAGGETVDVPQKEIDDVRARVARAEEAVRLLAPYSRRRKGLFPQRTVVVTEEFRGDGRYDVAKKVVDEAHKVKARQQELHAELERQQDLLRALLPWLEYGEPLSAAGTETTATVLGHFPAGSGAWAIGEVLDPYCADYRELHRDASGVFGLLLTHRSDAEEALAAATAAGFTPATLVAGLTGTAKMEFDRAEKRKRELEAELARCGQNLSVLAGALTEVEILCDLETTALRVLENKVTLAATDSTVLLSGWCPVERREAVAEVLLLLGAAFEFSPPAEGDDVPVLLKNNSFAKNFEWVIGMYAYPKYGSFDPTFIMSIFYLLIFGLMFADAGYGLVMSLVCFGAVRFLHPAENMKRFLMMFGYCGISCLLMGVLFGAYFGNFPLAFMEHVLGIAPEALPRLSLLPAEAANIALWFDPLLNPMAFLILSLAVGAVHLVAGMAVQFYVLCRRGYAVDAVCDIATWWLVFAGLGLLFVAPTVGKWLAIAGVAGIVLTHGRAKQNPVMRLLSGLLGLYDGINYAADLLSYSRILALGLAAGVIAQVVNVMATMGGASVIGILLMLVVFVIGHLLNLAINVLGSFVHASRLQYIEFFGKFYEDGGTPFRPMTCASQYSEEAQGEKG